MKTAWYRGAILAFLLWGGAVAGEFREELPAEHPKCRTTRQVFDALVDAVGDGRTPPILRIRPRELTGRKQVIWFDAALKAITLEERTYDLCAGLGPDSLDALSFLLGHELAHYYKNHGWVGDFGSGLADLKVGQQLEQGQRDPERMAEIETEADLFGGFFGHLAGYAPLQTVSAILPAIYAAYGLSEQLPGYPALAERLEVARRSQQHLAALVPIFEAGHHLLLIKRYEEAARCFAHLASTFPSREILNNVGVAHALEALEFLTWEEPSFAYPFELDARTRLQRGPKAAVPDPFRQQHGQQLLGEAREWFEQARHKDPSYLPAYLDLAGVADLQGELDEALFWAGQALKRAGQSGDETVRAHALILRGIAHFHGDPVDRQAARQDFAQALAGAPSLARLNLAILDGERDAASGIAAVEPAATQPESLAGLDPRHHRAVIDSATAMAGVPEIDRSRPALNIYVRGVAAGDGLVVETRYATFSFLKTRPDFAGRTARGVRLGDDLAQLQAAYGQETYLMAGREETYHVYEQARLVFRVGTDGRVQGWVIYAVD